jgi:hypothetical protein
MTTIIRRRFLVSALGAATLSAPFAALQARAAAGGGRPAASPDYGPLAPVRDATTGLPLLSLPKGFEYVSYGWTGDHMSDGLTTPSSHDGMAAFRPPSHRRCSGADGSVTTRFPLVATRAIPPGPTTSVEPSSSTTAGPRTSSPGVRRARS